MTELKEELLQIINAELQSDDEDSYDIFEESVESMIEKYGGSETVASILDILKEQSSSECWYLATSVLSWLTEDSVELPCDWSYLVALLYVCLETLPDLGVSGGADGGNLVWSVAQSVADVDYMAEWNPLKDSVVQKQMEKIRQS